MVATTTWFSAAGVYSQAASGACGGNAEESHTARNETITKTLPSPSRKRLLGLGKPRPPGAWRPWPSAGSITAWSPLIPTEHNRLRCKGRPSTPRYAPQGQRAGRSRPKFMWINHAIEEDKASQKPALSVQCNIATPPPGCSSAHPGHRCCLQRGVPRRRWCFPSSSRRPAVFVLVALLKKPCSRIELSLDGGIVPCRHRARLVAQRRPRAQSAMHQETVPTKSSKQPTPSPTSTSGASSRPGRHRPHPHNGARSGH